MGYFVDGFDTSKATSLMQWARDDHDSYDQWGWAMIWLFDLCGELESRGVSAPPECEYRAGAFGPDVSEERAEGLAEFSDSALYLAARAFNRFCKALDAAGESY